MEQKGIQLKLFLFFRLVNRLPNNIDIRHFIRTRELFELQEFVNFEIWIFRIDIPRTHIHSVKHDKSLRGFLFWFSKNVKCLAYLSFLWLISSLSSVLLDFTRYLNSLFIRSSVVSGLISELFEIILNSNKTKQKT